MVQRTFWIACFAVCLLSGCGKKDPLAEVRKSLEIKGEKVVRDGATEQRGMLTYVIRDQWLTGSVKNKSQHRIEGLVLETDVDEHHADAVRTRKSGSNTYGVLQITIGDLEPGETRTFEHFLESGVSEDGKTRIFFLGSKYVKVAEGSIATASSPSPE